MKFLLTRSKSFHKPDGRRGAPDSIVTLAPGEVEAPEWIRDTNTYRAGVADGSIRDFASTGSKVFIPTRDQLVERGYAPDVADEIVVRQRELAAKFATEEKHVKEKRAKDAADLESLGLGGGAPPPVPSKKKPKTVSKSA